MSTVDDGSVHAVLFYRDDAEYLDAVIPFVRAGLDGGDEVLIAVPTRNLVLLRDALGDVADSVEMNDMAHLGGNPARTFPTIRELCDHHHGVRLRVIAEPVWPGRHPESYPACVQNEALYNSAFAFDNITTLCPYNAVELPDNVIADAMCTHPLIWQDGAATRSPDYSETEVLARFNEPLPADPRAERLTLRNFDDLRVARSLTTRCAEDAGLSADRAMDLELIVSELATNSLKYTDGGCELAFWRKGGALVCQVDDNGRLDDPLAGRRLPAVYATTGRGLFLVNALADLVRTHTSDSGTTIRVYIGLP